MSELLAGLSVCLFCFGIAGLIFYVISAIVDWIVGV